MRTAGLFLTLCLTLLADTPSIELQGNGFVVIHSVTLTDGKICRKLDRVSLPDPLAWHLRSEWNAIYLSPGPEQTGKAANPGCQRALARATLIGPLHKGKWQIHGITSTALVQQIAFTRRQKLVQTGAVYEFATEGPAILAVHAQQFSNTTGACREFVPLWLRISDEKSETGQKTIRASLPPSRPQTPQGGTPCRALPQTIAQAAIEIPAGSYRLSGETIHYAEIYAREPAAKSAKDSADSRAQQPVK